MNIKKIISWILVIVWLMIIFMFSAMDADNSNKKSEGAINKVVETTLNKTNDLGITNKHPSENKINKLVEDLNIPFRKCMHFLVYFVLALLLLNALYVSGFKNYKLYLVCIIACFIYSIFDEYHQTFVTGRTGQFTDSLIDTLGSTIGMIIYYFFRRKKS